MATNTVIDGFVAHCTYDSVETYSGMVARAVGCDCDVHIGDEVATVQDDGACVGGVGPGCELV